MGQELLLMGYCDCLLPASGPCLDFMEKGNNEELLQTAPGLAAKVDVLCGKLCGPRAQVRL